MAMSIILGLRLIGLDLGPRGQMNVYIMVYMVWAFVFFLYPGPKWPIHKYFFRKSPKNSALVIVNDWSTFEKPKTDVDRTKLQPTSSMRETGPGWQGLIPIIEEVGWTIDLGKQIVLNEPITAYTKDKVKVTVRWQVIITPLRGYLVNLVRHDDETIEKYFMGRCRSKIIQMISNEYSREILDVDGKKVLHRGFNEKIDDLKDKFKDLFDGPDAVSKDEKEFGVYTNDPQITEILRSDTVQDAVEATENAKITAEGIAALKQNNPKMTDKQAAMIMLTLRGLPTDGLRDYTITGLENVHTLITADNPLTNPAREKPEKNKKDDGKGGKSK
ncbi:MAG: SPFH domain-containing protein [Candidatus Paceibacterota bacterium]